MNESNETAQLKSSTLLHFGLPAFHTSCTVVRPQRAMGSKRCLLCNLWWLWTLHVKGSSFCQPTSTDSQTRLGRPRPGLPISLANPCVPPLSAHPRQEKLISSRVLNSLWRYFSSTALNHSYLELLHLSAFLIPSTMSPISKTVKTEWGSQDSGRIEGSF